jgi:hypothetical protein
MAPFRAWAGIAIDESERPLWVDSGQLGDLDGTGLFTLPPLGPVTTMSTVRLPHRAQNEPPRSLGNGCLAQR